MLVGRYAPGKGTVNECLECAVGTYANSEGRSNCTPAAAGYFVNETGAFEEKEFLKAAREAEKQAKLDEKEGKDEEKEYDVIIRGFGSSQGGKYGLGAVKAPACEGGRTSHAMPTRAVLRTLS